MKEFLREVLIKNLNSKYVYDSIDIKELEENQLVVDMKDGRSYKITIEKYD